MKHEEILERIQPIFHDVFDDEDLVILAETNADDVYEWDSLSQINLVVEMEKQFKVKFSISELQLLQNVGDMVKLILTKLG